MDFVTYEPQEQLRFTQTLKSEVKRNEDGLASPKRDSLYKSVIVIHNNDENKIVGFKIKTTSPKKYCVRPSYGKILPGKTVEISVTVNIQKDIKLDSKINDKFLVQTTVIPKHIYELSNEVYSKKISEIFSELEKLKKSDPVNVAFLLKEHRLLCNIEGLYNNDDVLRSPSSQNRNNITSTTINSSFSESTAQTKNSPIYNIGDKMPSSIIEANLMIKELENSIQKYSVEALKNDLLRKRRFEKDTINESTVDGKKEITDPKELFFEWNSNQKKYILNKSCKWQIAFLIIIISFILGAYFF